MALAQLAGDSKWIVAILALYIGLAAIYCHAVPPFEGPDEGQHFAYVEWLANGHGLPSSVSAWETPMEQEAGQPPLYYMLASVPARVVGVTNPQARYYPNPHFPGPFPRANVGPFPRRFVDNDNRAIPTHADARPLRGGWLAFYLARSLTIGFGGMLVVFAYKLARLVRPDGSRVSLWAALLISTTPQFLFISSMVSNDVPAAALGTVAMWMLARLLRGKATARSAFALGAVTGLAVLTKVSMLTLFVPIMIGFAWLWLSREYTLTAISKLSSLVVLAAVMTCGWWFARDWLTSSSILGLGTHDSTSWAINDSSTLLPLVERWDEISRSYWMAFGWGTIRPATWVFNALAGLVGLALVGLVRRLFRAGFVSGSCSWARSGERVPGAGDPFNCNIMVRFRIGIDQVLLLVLWAHLVATAIALEYWQHRVIAHYGRLLFPSIAAISILLVIGWQGIHARLAALCCVPIAILALIAPFAVIKPAYHFEPLDKTLITDAVVSTGVRFGPSYDDAFAELISATPLQRSVKAHSGVHVRVCWRALDAAESDHTLFVHLVGPDDWLVANRYTYPGLGLYPTSAWRAGGIFCDLVQVRIDDPPETLVYAVEIGFVDPSLTSRVPAFDGTGQRLSHVFASRVRLERHDTLRRISDLSAPVELVDAKMDTDWEQGATHEVILEWAISEALEKDYQVFVHLRRPGTKEAVAQADGPPGDGWYPTSWWPPNQVIADRHSFALASNHPIGQYELVVGLYDLDTGVRWGEEHIAGTIEVVAYR